MRARNWVADVEQQPLAALGRVPCPLGEGVVQGVILDPIDGVDESAAGGGCAVEVVGAVDAAQERALGDSATSPAQTPNIR